MNGLSITNAVKQFGITSKTLRYYERVGLLQAKRTGSNNYRYYDEAEIERIKQIVILRKMQISIKDIIRIYENENMSTVVEVFANRLRALDEEVGALTELRRITNDFLQTMMQNGITKISAIPLLYDEMDKHLNELEERKSITVDDLTAVNERLMRPPEVSIIALPTMRVLSSKIKINPNTTDPDGFTRYTQETNMVPGNHERFEFQTDFGEVIVQHIPHDFVNITRYKDYIFPGGLFAAANVYLDEDFGKRFRALIKDFDDNKYYQIDYQSDGNLRHPAMLENLISPDDQRELVSLLVPVKKRLADPALFNKPAEVTDITVAEIEAANPALWAVDVELDELTPMNSPYYRMTEDGEVEYTGWISTRTLNTYIAVKLPFRVDIEFRTGEYRGFGANDGSIRLYHGNHGLDHNYGFGINTGDNTDTQPFFQSISFHQPIFRDAFTFRGRGKIVNGEYNRLTWIIGKKHLACIINGEVRYCGTNFPYMALDLSREEAHPIVIGSERTKYIRSIRVSQLAETPKYKLKQGELTMITKQSNNIIPIIHRLVTDEYGENYWFNGCAKYVMESLGEKDYDYWFFAGVTGDVFTQHYTFDKYSGDAVSSYMLDAEMNGNPAKYTQEIFAKCGYAATYVSNTDLQKNTEMYLSTLVAYIDKGIPVIVYGTPLVGVVVGYEDYGKTVLYITGNKNQPERMTLQELLYGEPKNSPRDNPFNNYPIKLGGWIFVGEKKENRPLADIYREAIRDIPLHAGIKTNLYCFGAQAFRAWARDIENGKFDGMKPEDFDTWAYYTNYVCVLATNGSCCHGFLEKARALNPDMDFLVEVSKLYRKTAEMWGQNNDRNDEDSLEALGGGFNVTLTALQNKEKRSKIAAKIQEFADVTEEILSIIQQNL